MSETPPCAGAAPAAGASPDWSARPVADVMTREVIRVSPEAPLREVAQVMVDYDIGGLPVVDEAGRVVGMVTEDDLILRHARPVGRWWHAFLGGPERLAREYRQAGDMAVREVMATSVIAVGPAVPVDEVARLLHAHGIRRLPVIDEGRLAGIVSRADLVRALAQERRPEAGRAEARLVSEMYERLAREPWAANRRIVVRASDGALFLWGIVASEDERQAVERMARAIAGVASVENRLVVRAAAPYDYGR
jgi:CBS-domain-containing membrane protein